MKKTFAVILGCLLWASLALGISRVGGGTVADVHDGYETKLPMRFQKFQIFGDTGIRLEGPPRIFSHFSGSNFFQPQLINIYSFHSQYPELAGLNRAALEQSFQSRNWKPYNVSNPCIVAFQIENTTAITVALTWGAEKGIVFAGPLTSDVRVGIDYMINNLVLSEGACAWK